MLTLDNQRILVTGATGFVGSHVVQELLALQPELVVCTYVDIHPRSYFSHKKLSEHVVMAPVSICDSEGIMRLLSTYDIDIIFHLAAQPLVTVAYQHPLETIQTNVMGTTTILEAARRRATIKAIVIASSDKAYGKADVLPYTEQTALNGDHPYDVSKSAADRIATMYHTTYGLPVAITRFGNIFGQGDFNFSRIIPGAFEAIIRKQPLLLRSNGSMLRQYLYVQDVAKGYIMLAQQIEKTAGHAFNFGSNHIFTVLETIAAINKALGEQIDYRILNNEKNEIPSQHLDWTKVKDVIGWDHTTEFCDGVQESFTWYKDFYFFAR